jgi:hypothetical protein
MKLGAERKKVMFLAALVLLAAYFIYSNVFSSQPAPSAPTAAARPQTGIRPEALPELGRPAPRAEARNTAQTTLQEFRPSLLPKKAAERGELSSMDATLRLDLLAKLQEVRLQGGNRSLFEFSAAPLPKTPERKVIPKPLMQTVQLPPPPKPPEPEVKPVAPPIPLKFYGFATAFRQGSKRAFFLDGDQILVASEGEVLKKRYRVVRVGVNSVVMEDIQFKAEQTLPLVPQQVG